MSESSEGWWSQTHMRKYHYFIRQYAQTFLGRRFDLDRDVSLCGKHTIHEVSGFGDFMPPEAQRCAICDRRHEKRVLQEPTP